MYWADDANYECGTKNWSVNMSSAPYQTAIYCVPENRDWKSIYSML